MSRLLVVDDEARIRSFLSEALEMVQHTVDVASNGADALEMLRKHAYDVVLTDLKMPQMGGMELLRYVREDSPESQVIVLTAHGTVESAVQAIKLGAFDYLQKPISSLEELQLLVGRAVERKQLLALREQRRRETPGAPRLAFADPAMDAVVHALRKVAPTNASVLLTGESGTGKEVVSRAIHAWSKRRDGPFVALNCAALPPSLLESELFGVEKGAYTGASTSRRGRIELAAGGTFLLDEVGELEPAMQAKLLRVIEARQFERLGGGRTVDADVRWVAATNRDLPAMVAEGTFRADLYHRLAVFPIALPALRDRPRDILPLTAVLLERVRGELGLAELELDDGARGVLVSRPWPGNIRELANALERAAILAGGGPIRSAHLDPVGGPPLSPEPERLDDWEALAIRRALALSSGNRRLAAERLGIGERTLYTKIKQYGIE